MLRRDLHNALQMWAQHSKLSFIEVNSDEADILVYFEKGYHGDGFPFDGRGQILAHAFFPGGGRGGDVHFDIEETWKLSGDGNSQEDGTNLFAVAAHEFGHSLGLSHSTVPEALMFPWYQGLQPGFELPDDDRYGIQQIYGAKEKLWSKNTGARWPHKPTYRPSSTTTSTTSTTTTTARTTTTSKPKVVTTARTTTTKKFSADSDKPDTCDSSYDAISVIRREVFVFKGKYVWRIGDKGLYSGYPALTERLWKNLPKNFVKIDAVYERQDKKIVFFIGKYYYVFSGNFLEPGYPLPLAHLGLPTSLPNIDAVMIWGYNSKTYIFSGTMYWRLDEDTGKVELDYPRDMSVWKGIGYNIDAAFQWKDGVTYFFKGKGFWPFNDLRMRVKQEKQKSSAQFWMGCPAVGTEDPGVNSLPTYKPKYHFQSFESTNLATKLKPLALFWIFPAYFLKVFLNNLELISS